MAGWRERASGWLCGRLRSLFEWPCRQELQELREQRRRFIALLDAVEDMVVLHDPDGRLRFANRTAARIIRGLTGRDWTELVGKTPAEIGLPAALARLILDEIARVNASGGPVTTEVELPVGDGVTRWQEQRVSPVFTDGRMTSHIIVGRDVDERKRAQRRLELLSKVSAIAGTLELDELLPALAKLSIPELADWSTVDVGDGHTVRRAYVIARDPGKGALADQLQNLKPWAAQGARSELLAGRSLFFPEVTDELLRVNTDGPYHLELVRSLGLRSAIAVPLRVRGVTVAVMSFVVTVESGRSYTHEDFALAEELAGRAALLLERARLYEQLKASEARFRIALAAGRVAVFEQDRALRYRWHYNAALGSAVGKTHADIFPSDEAAELDAIKQHVLDSGEKYRGEVALTWGDAKHTLTAAIDPVRDEGRAITGIIGAAFDITDEKRAQAELAQAVSFREQLMGILGHDLRNPLNAVLAASSILRRRADLSPPARDHIERIERASRRMAEMIRTLLDFTRLRFHGELPVSPAPADLGEVARAIVDELRAAEPEHAIELDVRGDARGQWDPARLGEVLSNLVGNALAHGDGEPVHVTIDDAADEVWLRVHNGGPAIAPEARAALFEPFRGVAQRNGGARAHGLGLGLYIVRQIVQAHGGTITVDSTPRDGTTFTVRLPRAAHAAAALSAVP